MNHQNMTETDFFSRCIIEWYKANGRELPWRQTKDPYKIWISEIILQQTRVIQGYGYYKRFISRFPDLHTLANANEDEVMKHWQGLGYYSRCRNLYSAAQAIESKGHFPTSYTDILNIKGVGEYTAAAICSFAYDMPYPVVDGNVYRVLARWMGISTPVDTNDGKKLFKQLADSLIDKKRPAIYNQAIMDFGALQCTPQSPKCETCPLQDSCIAFGTHSVDRYPYKKLKTKTETRFFYYFYTRTHDNTHIYINKRNSDGIWANLYEFPLIESKQEMDDEKLFNSDDFIKTFSKGTIESINKVASNVKHVLSHRTIHASCYVVNMKQNKTPSKHFKLIREEDFDKFPVSRLVSRFFSLILKPNH